MVALCMLMLNAESVLLLFLHARVTLLLWIVAVLLQCVMVGPIVRILATLFNRVMPVLLGPEVTLVLL